MHTRIMRFAKPNHIATVHTNKTIYMDLPTKSGKIVVVTTQGVGLDSPYMCPMLTRPANDDRPKINDEAFMNADLCPSLATLSKQLAKRLPAKHQDSIYATAWMLTIPLYDIVDNAIDLHLVGTDKAKVKLMRKLVDHFIADSFIFSDGAKSEAAVTHQHVDIECGSDGSKATKKVPSSFPSMKLRIAYFDAQAMLAYHIMRMIDCKETKTGYHDGNRYHIEHHEVIEIISKQLEDATTTTQ